MTATHTTATKYVDAYAIKVEHLDGISSEAKDMPEAQPDLEGLTRDLRKDAALVPRELREFESSARFITDHRAELLALHARQWIGVYHGALKAAGPTFSDVIDELKRNGIPPENTLVRFVDYAEETLVI